jgi:hypothetical protein
LVCSGVDRRGVVGPVSTRAPGVSVRPQPSPTASVSDGGGREAQTKACASGGLSRRRTSQQDYEARAGGEHFSHPAGPNPRQCNQEAVVRSRRRLQHHGVRRTLGLRVFCSSSSGDEGGDAGDGSDAEGELAEEAAGDIVLPPSGKPRAAARPRVSSRPQANTLCGPYSPDVPATVDQVSNNLDTNARVLSCAVCSRRSDKVRWFILITVRVNRMGAIQILVRPDGDLCFVHGAGWTAYPRLSVDQLLTRIDSEPSFRSSFEEVSVRCASVGERLFQQMTVSSAECLSAYTFVDFAAIPTASVTENWLPPNILKIMMATIPVPPGRQKEECYLVYPADSVGGDVFHFIHRVGVGDETKFETVHLDHSKVARLGQCEDVFHAKSLQHLNYKDSKFAPNGMLGKRSRRSRRSRRCTEKKSAREGLAQTPTSR